MSVFNDTTKGLIKQHIWSRIFSQRTKQKDMFNQPKNRQDVDV